MDENVNVNPETETVDSTAQESTENVSAAEFNSKMAELMTEVKRLKTANDKLSSENAKWKKEVMATKTEAEQLSIEKAERDAALQAELEELRKESAINKYSKSYMAIGYTEEQAQKAAEAQFAGDFEELNRIQKAFQDEYAKQIKAELMKSMPAPAVGNDDSVQMTKEQYKALSYREQLDFKQKHPTAYQKLTQ